MNGMIGRLAAFVVGVVALAAVAASVLAAVAIAALAYGLYRGGRALWRRYRHGVELRAHQRAELLARAELQHRWFLEGDLRGTYGRYQPAVTTRR